MTFAARTEVPVERSKSEIERLLMRHGATSFAGGWTPVGATVLFEMKGRRLRFELPLPTAAELKSVERRDRETRRRWRCLVLVIKAKLEAVETKIVSFEDEFLAHIVLPGTGETFGAWAAPQIAAAYDKGLDMPPLLGSGRP
jgi:hypothetical protein